MATKASKRDGVIAVYWVPKIVGALISLNINGIPILLRAMDFRCFITTKM
jgi:hypothetical protein